MLKPKNLAQILVIVFLLVFSLNVLIAAPAKAQLDTTLDVTEQLDTAVSGAYQTGGSTNLLNMIGNTIKIVLQFLGIILLILIIYGGFLWMTSAGDEEKVGKAKKIISAAVIGVIIVVLAYVITYFVMNKLIPGITAGSDIGT